MWVCVGFFRFFSTFFPSLSFSLFAARNSIKIYLNTNGHGRSRCSLSYTSKRKATFGNDNENVICYQIQSDNDSSYSVSDPHIISSKKLSVGLRRWVHEYLKHTSFHSLDVFECLSCCCFCCIHWWLWANFLVVLFYSTFYDILETFSIMLINQAYTHTLRWYTLLNILTNILRRKFKITWKISFN